LSSPRRPRAATIAALFLSALALLVTAASPAWAAPAKHNTTGDYISLQSASSPNNDQGELSVDLWSSSALTTATVHIFDSTGTTDLLDPAVTETSGAGSAGGSSTWTVTTPITESQLPLGEYLVVVDAADDGGTTITGLSQEWYFAASPQVTINVDHTDISFDDPTATVTGQVTLVAPDGTVTPYQGPITLNEGWGISNPGAETDANGDYSVTVSPTAVYGTSPQLWVQAYNGATGRSGASATITFSVTTDPAHVTAKLSPSTATYGSRVTLSGTVTYKPAGSTSFVPVTRPVEVYASNSPYGSPDAVATGANGDFSITVAATAATWSVNVQNALLGGASATVPLTLVYKTEITGFKTSLNQYWGLSYSGCLGLPAKDSAIYGSIDVNIRAVKLQWAPSPNGPWHTLATKTSQYTNDCGNNGLVFSGTGTAPVNYAYYRAYYPGAAATGGTATSGGTGYASTNSSTVLTWKYDDRITGFSVSPTSVSPNGKITARGQLQYWNDKAWHDYSGQTVLIIFKGTRYCSATWCWIVKAKTNSSGKFSVTFSDFVGSTNWAADFEGNSTHLAAGSPNTVYVRI
jgi:hypothetical protein